MWSGLVLVGLMLGAASAAPESDDGTAMAASLPGPGGPATASTATGWPATDIVARPAAAAGGLALLVVLSPLYHRLDRDRVVAHPLRRRVLCLVDERPGLSINRLAAELAIDYRTARHHLDKLEAFGLVSIVRRGNRCHVLPTAAAGLVPRGPAPPLLEIVARRPGLHLASAAKAMGRARTTVRFQLEKLEGDGLVRIERDGGVMRLWPTAAGMRSLDAKPAGTPKGPGSGASNGASNGGPDSGRNGAGTGPQA